MITHTRNAQGAGSPSPLRYMLPAPAGAVLLGLHRSTLTGLGVTATGVVLLLLAKTPLWAVLPLAVAGARNTYAAAPTSSASTTIPATMIVLVLTIAISLLMNTFGSVARIIPGTY